LFLENQYFRVPNLADAIVRQSEAQRELISIFVVSSTTDDPDNPLTDHGRALQHDFFARLANGIPASRLRVYTQHKRLVHSKLILADDRAFSLGSANCNPRGFFLDREFKVTVDDAASTRSLRRKLWAHNLGLPEDRVEKWGSSDFIREWDAVAAANAALLATPQRMSGEGVLRFDHSTVKGKKTPLMPDVLTEL
jgi:phosphatidylserine/phosphatidylglycerophosphate/cardiolipin synthase-like enzyme